MKKILRNKKGFISTSTIFMVMVSFIMLLMLTLQGFINDDKIKTIYINDLKIELIKNEIPKPVPIPE